jgi:IS5 family transposase
MLTEDEVVWARSFADLEYQGKRRKTLREVFLERMDGLIPWKLLEDRISPFYPKAGRGRLHILCPPR